MKGLIQTWLKSRLLNSITTVMREALILKILIWEILCRKNNNKCEQGKKTPTPPQDFSDDPVVRILPSSTASIPGWETGSACCGVWPKVFQNRPSPVKYIQWQKKKKKNEWKKPRYRGRYQKIQLNKSSPFDPNGKPKFTKNTFYGRNIKGADWFLCICNIGLGLILTSAKMQQLASFHELYTKASNYSYT